eukprot:CAMPEP_0170535906 /NCGR_PEP_ID=MMETSP0209-20121228/101854_1 /TAXON_ID=665100 ORGANISM="Litonotus pictus, Strain P1" /NCGR_SAMPLE_ID=MMETSP0209 /ASSEMBLY_ACC=CAM_ASM_000301 /LENGTH=440 /DNA_ID=CAMNT_0010837215 /DNA_START=336 /DNA_END=1658 /DNA_ORIENTATION=-
MEVSPREVYEAFSVHGEIASIKMNEKHGAHFGYGYIAYEASNSAIAAISNCNGKAIFSKSPESVLEVEFFKRVNERGNTGGEASNSAIAAISNCNGKAIFSKSPESVLEVEFFKRVNERGNTGGYEGNIIKNDTAKMLETNSSLFVKNLPENTSEEEIRKLFEPFGTISYFKPNYHPDNKSIKTSILSYNNEGSASKAEKEMNDAQYKGTKITVEKLSYSTVVDSKNTKIGTEKSNVPFNKNCALYISNLPDRVDEEILRKVFLEFGSTKKVTIYKTNYMQKVGGTFKEVEVSNGSGQILYDTPEEALLAKEKMNGKFLPGFETWKRPLYVEIYMSSKDRNAMKNTNSFNPYQNMQNMMNMGYMPPMMNQGNQGYNKYGGGYNQSNQGYGQNNMTQGNNNKTGFGTNVNEVTQKVNNLNVNTNNEQTQEGKSFEKIDMTC